MSINCCGLREPHEHLCSLGPQGWLYYAIVAWWNRRP